MLNLLFFVNFLLQACAFAKKRRALILLVILVFYSLNPEYNNKRLRNYLL